MVNAVCDERPSLHIKFKRPSCWMELFRRLANIGKKLSFALQVYICVLLSSNHKVDGWEKVVLMLYIENFV